MKKALLIIFSILFSLIAFDLTATDYTTSGGNWNVKTTWSPSGIPGATDNVTISGIVSLKGDESVNNITINSGTLDIGGNTLTINGSVSGTGTITGSSTSILIISGTGILGTLYFTSGSEQLSSLVLNRTSGDITLGTNLVVSSLTLTNGVLSTGTNKLTLGTATGSTGTLSPAVPTNASYINGNFERWLGSALLNVDVYFPLGSASSYRPVKIKYTAAPTVWGRLLGTEYDADPGSANTSTLSDAGPYTLDKYSNEAYWKFTTTEITGGTYSISLGAYGISGISGVNWNRLRVIKRTGGSSSLWGLSGTHTPCTGSSTLTDVNRTGLTGFSEFGVSGYSGDGNTLSNSPLPVLLTSFTSQVKDRNVRLSWNTSTEVNNKGFDIERKTGTADWLRIGFAEAKGGFNVPASYTFEDNNLQSGKYSYRLKQTDYNGNYEYYELNGNVVIGVPCKFAVEQNYPNPFNPSTTIKFSIPERSNVMLKIYDVTGREVETLVNGQMEAGYYSAVFRAERVSSGVYFYTLDAGKYRGTGKMSVIK